MPRKNEPISELKVVELERRTQGGRAYKVVHYGGYLVDMREDVIMDVIFNAGIDEGGVLKGEFVWARHGSEMKLVRVGSQLHKDLVEATNRKKEKKISNKDLVVGGIYETAGGSKAVYLGRVDCEEANSWRKGGTFYGISRIPLSPNTSFGYEIRSIGTNILGFCELNDYSKNRLRSYQIKLKKSHSFVRKVEDYDGDPFEALKEDSMDTYSSFSTSQHEKLYGKFYGECTAFKGLSIRPTGEPLPSIIEENFPDFYEEVVKTCHPMFKK
jgi:hypothetical protein